MTPQNKERIAQIKRGEIPKGYKATKGGIVPCEWDFLDLGKLSSASLYNGVFNDPKKVGAGVPLINVVNIYDDEIDFDKLSRLDVSDKELEKYEALEDDLLFTRSSLKLEGIAHCNIVKKYPQRVVYDCHLMRLRPNKNLVSPFFLYKSCLTHDARCAFMRNAKTTTMTTIDQKGLSSVKIFLPPLAEQEKIAAILSKQDELIELQTKIIAEKQVQKKGLMQFLLTGKKRLKGFSGKWEKKKIKDICKVASGTTPSRMDKANFVGENLWITSGELKSKYLFDTTEKISDVAIASSRLKLYKENTLIIAIYGLEAAGIRGSASIVKKPCTISQACMAFTKLSSTTTDFLYYWYVFNGERIGTQYAQGTKQQNLSVETVNSLKIHLPPLAEQEAIAAVLSSADKEIEILQAKLEEEKRKKKALMQMLLTGKVRVKV